MKDDQDEAGRRGGGEEEEGWWEASMAFLRGPVIPGTAGLRSGEVRSYFFFFVSLRVVL